ncbi:MAG: 4-phosphopantetheinyl transferase [Paracoccus sp. (in: a-proteobacteria)]|uniref:4'-phosphopantetheinyl transferase family protein n=1 Tax=Paracoccus sp. TaxID=267 RepID=UPI0039E2B8A5
MSQAPALRDLARRLLPEGFGIAVLDLADEPAPLLPAEAAGLARAVPKRQREFAAGRQALRLALARAGHLIPPDRPIAALPDRRPDLPRHVLASLSHAGGFCIAIASPPGGPSIGVDLEPAHRPLPEGLAEAVAPYRACPDRPLLAFCAKEAMFKAQYPLTGRMLDFREVPAVIRGDRVRACMGRRMIGARWAEAAGYLLAISLWNG